MLLGTYEQACRAVVAEGDAVGLRVAAPQAGPRPDHARAVRSPSSTTRRWRTIGIKRVVNGPFTFSPDGNPLVGPVRGLRGYWVACGVMAGLSQGGGVGLALATLDDQPATHGDSGMDIWAMDVARYGDYADARLHEREGPGELPAAVPDHVPERGAAGRAGRS